MGGRHSFPVASAVPDVVLQLPHHVLIGLRPYSWNPMLLRTSSLEGFLLSLPAQVTSGTLSYQVVLRPLATADAAEVPETRTLGSIRIDLTGPATTLMHKFDTPLRSDLPSRDDDADFTVEIDVSWNVDPGAPPLAVAHISVPRAEA